MLHERIPGGLDRVRELSVVGKATPKKDGPEKVTGRTATARLVCRGSPTARSYAGAPPHARIVRSTPARAAALPACSRCSRRATSCRSASASPGIRPRSRPTRCAASATRWPPSRRDRGHRRGGGRAVEVDYEELPAVFVSAGSRCGRARRVCTTSAPDNLTDSAISQPRRRHRAFAEAAGSVGGVYRLTSSPRAVWRPWSPRGVGTRRAGSRCGPPRRCPSVPARAGERPRHQGDRVRVMAAARGGTSGVASISTRST